MFLWAEWESNPHENKFSLGLKPSASANSATRPGYKYFNVPLAIRNLLIAKMRSGGESNPRIAVLQTAALATSPPDQILGRGRPQPFAYCSSIFTIYKAEIQWAYETRHF